MQQCCTAGRCEKRSCRVSIGVHLSSKRSPCHNQRDHSRNSNTCCQFCSALCQLVQLCGDDMGHHWYYRRQYNCGNNDSSCNLCKKCTCQFGHYLKMRFCEDKRKNFDWNSMSGNFLSCQNVLTSFSNPIEPYRELS